MEERALLGSDVDERGLNARQYCFDLSEIDVADHAACVGTVDQKFNELVVLEDGDPRLARVALIRISRFIVTWTSRMPAATRRRRR